MALSDRLAVIHAGTLSTPQPTAEVTVSQLGLLMGGVQGATPGAPAPAMAAV
jgi:simple sugar transport system ATP-binding protein